MGRRDFYSDLSERNREAFTSFSMSQSPLSFSVSFSVYSSPLSWFHRLSPQSPLRTFSVYRSTKVWGLQNRFLNFLISSPLFLCFFLYVLIASLCFYLGVRPGLTGFFFFNFFFIMRGFQMVLLLTVQFNLSLFKLRRVWILDRHLSYLSAPS